MKDPKAELMITLSSFNAERELKVKAENMNAQLKMEQKELARILGCNEFEKIKTPSNLPNLVRDLQVENNRLNSLINTPELKNFSEAVIREAAHQRERWGVEHDSGKNPEDWFWLLGYLAGKALHAFKAGDKEKALHHTISSAAALANWHASINGDDNRMRPGQ